MNFSRINIQPVTVTNIQPTLKKLISIPSVSGNEHNISEYLETRLKKLSFVTELIETPKSGPSIFAFHDYRQPGPRLLFYGHTDTVNVVSSWRYLPFKPTVTDGRLYGLGALDMKGGLAAILAASESLVEMKLSGSLALAFASDEEAYSRGCDSLIKSGKLKGISAAVSAEPVGLSVIELGRYGRAVYEFTVQGFSSHAYAESDTNALDDACKIVLALRRFSSREMKMTVLSMSGGTEFLSVPDSCKMLIDRPLKLGETKEAALEEMVNLVKSLQLRYNVKIKLFKRPTPYMTPYRTSSNHKIVKVIEKACLKVRKTKPEKIIGRCAGDENYLVKRAGIPTVSIGPEGGNAHAADEYVNLSSVVDVANIYIDATSEFLKPQR